MNKLIAIFLAFVFSVTITVSQKLQRERLTSLSNTNFDIRNDLTIMRLSRIRDWKDLPSVVVRPTRREEAEYNLPSDVPYAIVRPRISAIFERLLPGEIMASRTLYAFIEDMKVVYRNNVWKIEGGRIRILYYKNVIDEDGNWKEVRILLKNSDFIDKIRNEIEKCEVYVYEPEALLKSDIYLGELVYN